MTYRDRDSYPRFEGWQGVVALLITLILVGYSLYSCTHGT